MAWSCWPPGALRRGRKPRSKGESAYEARGQFPRSPHDRLTRGRDRSERAVRADRAAEGRLRPELVPGRRSCGLLGGPGQGYYKQRGLDVDMQNSKGSGDSIAKVDTGRADV